MSESYKEKYKKLKLDYNERKKVCTISRLYKKRYIKIFNNYF